MFRMRTGADGGPVVEVVDRPGLLLPRVTLRPMDHGETEPLQRVFAGLSAESRRLRYLGGVPELSPGMLRTLTDVDHDRHGAWAAFAGPDAVAVGRYVRLPKEPAVAEVALEVVDRCQGHGLGRLLMEVVAAAAADAGATELMWLMDTDNVRMRHLVVPLPGRFRFERGTLEGRTGLPAVRDADSAQVVRLARIARRRAAAVRAA
jgi:GNAT superfamily N-acetyltransferase